LLSLRIIEAFIISIVGGVTVAGDALNFYNPLVLLFDCANFPYGEGDSLITSEVEEIIDL